MLIGTTLVSLEQTCGKLIDNGMSGLNLNFIPNKVVSIEQTNIAQALLREKVTLTICSCSLNIQMNITYWSC